MKRIHSKRKQFASPEDIVFLFRQDSSLDGRQNIDSVFSFESVSIPIELGSTEKVLSIQPFTHLS